MNLFGQEYDRETVLMIGLIIIVWTWITLVTAIWVSHELNQSFMQSLWDLVEWKGGRRVGYSTTVLLSLFLLTGFVGSFFYSKSKALPFALGIFSILIIGIAAHELTLILS